MLRNGIKETGILKGICHQDMAVVMTAYKDIEFIKKNIDFLHNGFDIFIHIDKKTVIPESFIEFCKKLQNVWIERIFSINWGDVSHVKAITSLLFLANSVGKYQRYVIMSENESSVYTIACIKDFFIKNDKTNFMEIVEPGGGGNERDRVNYFYFQYKYNEKGTSKKDILRRLFWKKIELILKKLNIRPNYKNSYTYKGYVYCALNNAAVNYLVHNKKKVEELINESKTLYVPEEYFFQNIFLGSEISETLQNNALIFDDWTNPEMGLPKWLDKEDFARIKESGKLFCRKISSESDLVSLLFSEAEMDA